ncbi:putative Cofilin actophorin [Fasciola gigantica]|uniref:Putative Cofilin actophorin n=1 Tax=Fasciola gigantica TaxID=46835 RepID=A0A504Z805_FASGI|nr:putative Cofilin actophorin [Fasciola gigantica]
MASGIKCSDTCVDAFNDMKFRKTHRYILYEICDDKEIRVSYRAKRSATFGDFIQDLVSARKEKKALYAVYDYESPGKMPYLVFIVWTPTDIEIRKKMIYAASTDAIKRKLIGLKTTIQAHDLDDITEEEILKKTS